MISPYLTVAAVQSSLHWENKEANLHMFTEKLRAWNGQADIIVLPEMFTTGFSMQPERFAEPVNGRTLGWMQGQAFWKKAVIVGSFIVEEQGRYYNRLLWVNPDGSYKSYNKRHLFRMAGEDKHYAAGNDKLIVEINGWKVCPLVCYDLRFPVWSRNRFRSSEGKMEAEYDLLIYIANWPERRAHAWKTLLMARAMENLAYVSAVNRVGNDGNFIYHSGDSAMYNFRGDLITAAMISTEEVISERFSMQELTEFRKAFPAGLDADDFMIR